MSERKDSSDDLANPADGAADETPEEKPEEKRSILLGLGFDGEDGHTRVSRVESSVVIGGSHSTHEQLSDSVLSFQDVLSRYGRRLEDLSPQEYYQIVSEIGGDPQAWLYGGFPPPSGRGWPRG